MKKWQKIAGTVSLTVISLVGIFWQVITYADIRAWRVTFAAHDCKDVLYAVLGELRIFILDKLCLGILLLYLALAGRRQAMKKPIRKKAHFKTSPIKMSLAKVYFGFCLCVLIYALSTPILTVILKHHGNRCKGTITANESSLVHRWTSNNYLYELT